MTKRSAGGRGRQKGGRTSRGKEFGDADNQAHRQHFNAFHNIWTVARLPRHKKTYENGGYQVLSAAPYPSQLTRYFTLQKRGRSSSCARECHTAQGHSPQQPLATRSKRICTVCAGPEAETDRRTPKCARIIHAPPHTCHQAHSRTPAL